jgi:pantetheine-phosphate adenylyltransferase
LEAFTLTTAIYAGSFDPITNGHVAIIRAGLVAFERLTVAIVRNPSKSPLFSLEDRKDMISKVLDNDPRVDIESFEQGLLVDYARRKGANVILKGLRAVGDFDTELQMATMNRQLAPDIVTVFIMANDYFYVSSTLIKEVASLGGALDNVVHPYVESCLRRAVADASLR